MVQVVTRSGIVLKPVFTPTDLGDWGYSEKLGDPAEYPFTRGGQSVMYRDSPRGSAQYAGFGTPETTNQWFKYLISQGATGLSAATDLPTQIGYDSDHPLAEGEVGKQGVSINSLGDWETMIDGIPLDRIGVGILANATGPIGLAWILAANEKRGIPLEEVRVGLQNDPLKEFIARGTQIFPPGPSVKLACDVVEYCVRNKMKYARPLSCCGSHMRQAGATAPQEMGFMLANAVAYIEELIGRGLKVDDFAPHLSIYLSAGMDLFEEACKFRAIRRMWARMMKERFQANTLPVVTAYTAGSQFTAQQPLNNIVRGTTQLLGAILGGLSGAVVASYDEALALPSAEAVRVALRTQQIVAEESGVKNVVDPLGGSYYIEWLTDELEKRATEIFDKVQSMGGAIVAIEQGFQQREIARSAYEEQKRVESGERVVVGVNKYVVDEPITIEVRKVDPEEERKQVKKVKKLRKERDNEKVRVCLKQVKEAAEEGVNLVPCLLDAVKVYATIGEICDTLRGVYGEHKAIGL